jgi:hypothetical protein
MAPRITLPSDEVLSIGLADLSGLVGPLGPAQGAAYMSLGKLHSLDAVTLELCRLRNARHQDCNL